MCGFFFSFSGVAVQKGFRFNEYMQIHFGIADAHFICV